jgi:AbrB family looped-hinge helix DNA binding protein
MEKVMPKYILRPSSKNQVTIPKPVREALGVGSREPIAVIVDEHGTVTLEPANLLSIAELEGILPPLGRPTSPDFSVEIREAMDEAADKLVRDMGGL